MIYQKLTFPDLKDRPFFYTNYVATVDGKTEVLENSKSYWPIGSQVDRAVFIRLRGLADCLIHGKNAALHFRTVDSLAKNEFKKLRKKLGKVKKLPYLIITNHPNQKLFEFIKNTSGIKPYLLTSRSAKVPKKFSSMAHIVKLGQKQVELKKLSQFLNKKGYKHVLVEGGSDLVGQLLEADLLDQIFLTVAPKIFGNHQKSTLTMIEGVLFPPQQIKKLKLLSVKQVGDELFLRYQVVS